MKSILQSSQKCLLCGKTSPLEEHHVFEGVYRQRSDKYGLTVLLCPDCHRLSPNSVHRNGELNRLLKKAAQERFEEKRSSKEFMKIFKKSWRDT